MRHIIVFITLCLFTLSVFASSGGDLAKKYNLSANQKAMKQWERVFKKERKMKKLRINKLSDEEKSVLKEYLIKHAADSDQPAAAGL